MTDDITRPIIGIENRTAQEAFDIMCDRIIASRSSADESIDHHAYRVAHIPEPSRSSAIVEEPMVVACVGEAHDHPAHDWRTTCLNCGVFRGSDLYAQPHTGRAEPVVEEMAEALRKCLYTKTGNAIAAENVHVFERAAKALEAYRALALTVQPEAPTHQHVKRGSTYTLIGYGKMQAENWVVLNPSPKWEAGTKFELHGYHGTAADMQEVAIYRSTEDGSLWVRPREEFEDGRFIELPARVAP